MLCRCRNKEVICCCAGARSLAFATCTLMFRNVVPPATRLHRAGVRHDDDIVLVGPLNAEAFRSEHAANDKWYVLNPQGLANGIIVAEDLRGGCLSDNTHLIGAAHILRGERSALG